MVLPLIASLKLISKKNSSQKEKKGGTSFSSFV
jgi:hypothetical protein